MIVTLNLNLSDLKCHTEGHDAIDCGKTFPCQQCSCIGKTLKRLADHKQAHKLHRCHYVGCNAVYNHWQKLFNHKKMRITFKVCCNKDSRYLVLSIIFGCNNTNISSFIV